MNIVWQDSVNSVMVCTMKYLILLAILSSVLCFNFDTNSVQEIRANGTISSYFGYALLLQKGNKGFSPTIIVGAPGQGSGKAGGSVYSCAQQGLCSKYSFAASSANSPNGNFLGSVLDGGETSGELLIACAPRVVRAVGEHNYLNGLCFSKSNSSDIRGTYRDLKPLQNEYFISQDPVTKSHFYDYGFGEAGFDVKYVRETNTVLFGAPGVKNWNGALIAQTSYNKQIMPKKTAPVVSENFGYLGYAIAAAKFDLNGKTIYYVVGSPRASNLLGNVKIFNNAGRLFTTLTSNEIGSYYGSSLLAADLSNDLSDDILVGAPMGAGTTWDEGYVYFYKTTRLKIANPVKLVGNKKPGARFGTSIASIGDIDLDSYNDVAISAPHEDDGVGAVYIYMGSKTGIQTTYSQRLSPSDFSGNTHSIRGFGQGLSKGVDVDDNGHNDIAIGAYKSNQAFVIKTLSVIDYKLTLESNVTSISSSSMNITFCVYYSQRSPTRNFKTLQFGIELELDYRVPGATHFTYNLTPNISQTLCSSLTVTVQKSPLDITPFKLSLKSNINQKGIIGKGESKIEKSIPFSHGCGNDNICQTQILVQAQSNLQHIVLGWNKELTAIVSADNVGEPGYACELHMNFSSVLELRNTRDCNLENSTYICPFASRLEKMARKEIPFKFDIKLTKPSLDRVTFNFELKCSGVNIGNAHKNELQLDIKLINSPYIQGSSDPTNFYFTDENLEKDVEVSHNFRIANTGPSPVKLDVFLALPMVKRDDIDIFDIDAKGSLSGIEVQCNPTNKTFELQNTYNVTTLLTEPLNKTIVIDCLVEDVECLILFCVGDYLYRPTEIAEYNVKITTRTNLLAAHYQNKLLKNDILAFVSSAYIFNSTNRIEGHTATMIFTSKSKPIPLWIYIVAGILGIILLALLVLVLYKCHFFDRNYRDKMNDEKLMEQRSDDDNMDNMDNLDPVNLEEIPSQ